MRALGLVHQATFSVRQTCQNSYGVKPYHGLCPWSVADKGRITPHRSESRGFVCRRGCWNQPNSSNCYVKTNTPYPMKKIASLLLSLTLASSALAGTSDNSKTVQPTIAPPQGCECFAPGFAMGAFGGAMFPSHRGEGVGGGGMLAEYFFTENLGIQGSYGVYASNSEHHQADGSIVFRMPIKSLCIAPYVMAGGGVGTNAVTRGDFHVGGGIEARFASLNCMGVFVDGNYYFASGNNADLTIARLGVKFRF